MLGYVNITGQLYPFRKATENFFLLFFRVPRQGVTKRKLADDLRDLCFAVSQTDQSCSVFYGNEFSRLRFLVLSLRFRGLS